MRTKLLDHLVSVGNKSGAMPPAPAGLKDLKSAIEGVPFSVGTRGMSGVVSLANMVPNLVEQIKTLGSMAAVGEFRNVLGRLQSELAGQTIESVSTEALTAALEKVVDVEEMKTVVGESTALMHSLRSYASAAGSVSEVSPGSGVEQAYTFVPNTDHTHPQTDIVGLVDDIGALEDGISDLEVSVAALREALTANRTYYVRTDGSDSNDGLANTAGGAFLTIAAAVAVVSNTLDLRGYSVVIQVGAGTYNVGTLYFLTDWVGDGAVTLKGDTTTPANVVINGTGSTIYVSNGIILNIEGFKLTSSTGACLVSDNKADVRISGNMDFGSASVAHLYVSTQAKMTCSVNYTISAGSGYHAIVADGGVLVDVSNTITLTGTPAFSGAFQYVARNAVSIFYSNTFSGSATGWRYNVAQGGAIFTNNSGTSYYPGSAVGFQGAGGMYDNSLGGGVIQFPASQLASADANALDDYEEGTFTPVVTGGTVAGTGTYTTQTGYYTKIGNIVFIQFTVIWTAHTGTGDLTITGLPFTSDALPSAVCIDNSLLTYTSTPRAVVTASTTKIELFQSATNATKTNIAMEAGASLRISGSYRV